MASKNRLSKKNIIYIIGVGMALYTLAGFFLLPMTAKNFLIDKLSQSLDRNVSIQKLYINPYTLTASVDGFAVKAEDKTLFLSVKKIFVDISFFSFFTFTPVISEISLKDPYINIIRYKDKRYNFTDIASFGPVNEKLPGPEKDKIKNEKIFGFILKNAGISGGKIVFTDNISKVSHTINNFSLSLPFLSTRTKNRYEKSIMDIDFILNQSKIDLHVESTPFAEDMATQIDIKTGNIDVLRYISFFPYVLPENIGLKNMDLNLDLQADYRKKAEQDSLVLQGKLNILNVDITGEGVEKIIKFPLLTMDILKSDIFLSHLNISNILIKTPVINLKRDKEGRLSVLNYFSSKNQTLENKEINRDVNSNKNPFNINIADFYIKDASVSFQDFTPKKEFTSKIFPLNIHMINFEKNTDISGECRLTARTGTKEDIFLQGRFQTNPVQVGGRLSLSNIRFNKYRPYYEKFLGCDIKKGRIDISSNFNLSQNKDKFNLKITNQKTRIQDLIIFDHKSYEEMINIPEFNIKGTDIDFENKKINTGIMTARDGKVLVKRLKDGRINLVTGFLPAADFKDSAPAVIKKDAGSSLDSSPWAFIMPSFTAQGFNIQFKDLTNKDPVSIKLSDISITGRDLESSGRKKGYVDARMTWNKNGRISIKADYTPSISRAALDIDLTKIDLKSLQPYFTDAIKILVTSGYLQTKGNLKLDLGDPSNKDIRFKGKTSLTSFVALDKQTASDFFKCSSLYLSGLDISIFPVNIKARDISLTDFYSRITVSDTGEINLNTIFNKNIQKEKKGVLERKKSMKPPQVHVENITLQGGHIRFSDYLTHPSFTAAMKQIAGSVTGLSSDEKSRAKLHLQGIHGVSSPLDIIGTINPLARKKFADINISFKDIELTDFTPYSSRYLGYKIEKGKLILDLSYKIDGNKLKSENRVGFDNFELGQRVKSDKATSLPVRLAISLLKDSDGRIDLDLPVTGKLDDPEFKIGSIIFKMVKNLILKVVTSPFSMIGSMFGGGEELSYVDFDYGKAILGKANYAKIDKLAHILQKKPLVKLEIQGNYDKLRDAESLRIKGFKNLIKSEKLKAMIASGNSAVTLEDIKIKNEDMQYYIPLVYARAKFPKPRNKSGIEKKLDTAEKKKLLITNIKIGKNNLRQLAMDRAKKVKSYLISKGKVTKKRIFLVEPDENNDSKNENLSRVKFLLK